MECSSTSHYTPEIGTVPVLHYELGVHKVVIEDDELPVGPGALLPVAEDGVILPLPRRLRVPTALLEVGDLGCKKRI